MATYFFHLDLLEDEQRLSMGKFDKCNYLQLLCYFYAPSLKISGGLGLFLACLL